ncbi:hypothetical protein [Paenibacillus sp. GCM10027626]|uniref:hypothetical protein n=1 Tax=Paenibacillus sp. GCM10027626 TaxID=3273411 RepID=UPI003628787C
MLTWKSCSDDGDLAEAILFILGRRHELGLPYAFETVIGSLYLAIDQGDIMLCRDAGNRPVAVIVSTLGTDTGEYADVENMEVLIAFTVKEHRGSLLFADGLARLADRVKASGVRHVMFYAAPQADYRRLFGKFASREDTVEKACGMLDLYRVSANDLIRYAQTIHRQEKEEHVYSNAKV